jgi:hypothetical protein
MITMYFVIDQNQRGADLVTHNTLVQCLRGEQRLTDALAYPIIDILLAKPVPGDTDMVPVGARIEELVYDLEPTAANIYDLHECVSLLVHEDDIENYAAAGYATKIKDSL